GMPETGEHLYTVVAVVKPDDQFFVGSCIEDYEPPIVGGLIRGDCDGDEGSDISDCVCIASFLFEAGAEPPCLQSVDVDDSGQVDLTDAVYLALHLFSGGPPPAPP